MKRKFGSDATDHDGRGAPDGGKSSEFRRRDDLLLAILAAKGSAGRSANFDARQF